MTHLISDLSHSKNRVPIKYLLLCLVIFLPLSCSSESSVISNQEARTNINEVSLETYEESSVCWTQDNSGGTADRFVGGLAIYDLNSENDDNISNNYSIVIFSSTCFLSEESLIEAYDASLNTRVLNTEFNQNLEFPENIPFNAEALSEADADSVLGINPEFPIAIIAVVGQLAYQDRDEAGNFRRLRIDRYQILPREMIGAFLYYPSDRKDQVEYYLDPDIEFDSNGYRIPSPVL